MRPLEAGAGGVMASMVRSARQAEEIVSWAKFHPRGCAASTVRAQTAVTGRMPGAEYFRRANAESIVAVQIEHIEAVEDVERIAAVPDLDFLFIGPADLSQSMGIPGEWEHPRMWAAVDAHGRAASTNHMPWAILPRDAAMLAVASNWAAGMLSVGMDAWAFQKGVKAIQEEFAEFFKRLSLTRSRWPARVALLSSLRGEPLAAPEPQRRSDATAEQGPVEHRRLPGLWFSESVLD